MIDLNGQMDRWQLISARYASNRLEPGSRENLVRVSIIRTLANLGPDAKMAVPALTTFIRSETRANSKPLANRSEVSRSALNALEKIDPEAYGKLQREMDSQSPQVISETPH